MIHELKAIDIHSHFNNGHRLDVARNENHSSNFDYLMDMYKAANIEKIIFSTYASVLNPDGAVDGNDFLYDFCEKYDNVYQMVVIEPRIKETYEQAKRMLNTKKCICAKLHPACHKYDLDEYADEIFSFLSDFNTSVIIHPEKDNAEYIQKIADRFPVVNFIIAHVGTFDGRTYAAAINNAKYANVYVDTSGAASHGNEIMEYMVKHTGSERILFGTDTYAAGFQRGRIEYAMIDEKDKANILRYNAEKLFGNLIK